MGIKRYLIERAQEKRKKFRLIEGTPSLSQRIEEIWRAELPEESIPEVMLAVDGSMNRKAFAGYVLYTVGAVSVLYREGKKANGEEEFWVDVDLLKPEEYSDARIRILMGILETKAALSRCSEASYVLIDGSIRGNILRPTVFSHGLPEDVKGVVDEIFNTQLEPNFSVSRTEPIDSAKYYGELKRRFKGREFALAAGYLEYLEYLHALRCLLEKCGEKIVAVSKHSDSRYYSLDPLLPDIAVLNHSNLPPGYTEPVNKPITPEEKYKFPHEFEEELRSYEFSIFFFRFPKGGVFKVETLADPEEVLSVLRYFSVKGYPYPLREAHELVKIKNADVELVCREFLRHRGVTGRESLGE